MRWLAILLGLPFVVSGQIQDLATTADGSQVYFATAYRQKGTPQAGYLKIFRIDANGLTLFRQLTLSYLVAGIDTNFYLAERPSVSSDGSVVGYTAERYCQGGSHCIGFIPAEGFLAGSPDQFLGDGPLTLSPDGRSYITSSFVEFQGNTVGISNLVGGGVTLNGYATIGDGVQSLANGPIALVTGASGPALWKARQFTPLSFKATPANARLDAAADMIVYETSPVANFELHSYSVASRSDVLLAVGGAVPKPNTQYPPPNPYFSPSLTLDGRTVSYLLNNVLFIQSTGGGTPTALTLPSDGFITDAVISGNGNVVFAATSLGRLLKIDVASGAKTELIAAVPQLAITGGTEVPGALLEVTMMGFAEGDPALVGAGADAPVVGRSGNTVTLQIPWEAAPGSTVQLVLPANPSLLEQANDISLQAGEPAFFTMPGTSYPPYAVAAHQDFSSVVSVASPARPGEIVHVYFTGLGPVTPSIATGAVTPAGTLYQLQTPANLACQFMQGKNMFPANILFAGLAPGMIGVDQVDIQIPAQAVAPSIQINCTVYQTIGEFTQNAQLFISP